MTDDEKAFVDAYAKLKPEERARYWEYFAVYGTAIIHTDNDGNVRVVEPEEYYR